VGYEWHLSEDGLSVESVDGEGRVYEMLETNSPSVMSFESEMDRSSADYSTQPQNPKGGIGRITNSSFKASDGAGRFSFRKNECDSQDRRFPLAIRWDNGQPSGR
jgi:hypothetical protein